MNVSRSAWVVLACWMALAPIGLARAGTWDGGGSDQNWTTVENWDGDALPATGEDVTFATGGSQVILGASRVVGAVTFTSPGFVVNGTAGGNFEFTDVVAATPGVYTVNLNSGGRWGLTADATWNIGTGAEFRIDNAYGQTTNTYAITKTGGGTVTLAGSNGYERFIGTLDVQGGVFQKVTAGDIYVGRLNISSGASMRSDLTMYVGRYVDGDQNSTIQGTWSPRTQTYKQGIGVMTFSGDGVFEHRGQYPALWIDYGTIRLDNKAVNNTNRFRQYYNNATSDYFWPITLRGGTLELIGNDTADSSERIDNFKVEKGLNTLRVVHGSGANATLNFRTQSGSFEGMLLLDGGADLNNGSGPGNFFVHNNTTNVSNRILGGWSRIGAEFVYRNSSTGVLSPLSPTDSSRVYQVEGAGATNNVLVNVAQASALTAATTINSLKVDGAYGVDLGGQTLTVGSGGLIQTGAANVAGISNGTLSATALYVQADEDLTIAAALAGTKMVKIGAGKLDITSDLPSGYTVYWAEGPLSVTNSAAATVEMYLMQDAKLVKAGTGQLTLRGYSEVATRTSTPLANPEIEVQAGVLYRNNSYGDYTFARGGKMTVAAGAKYWDAVSLTLLGWTIGGSGTMTMNSAVNGGGTVRTLTSNGGTIAPTALTVQGNLTLGLNGATRSTLAIGLGADGAPGLDYGTLTVTEALAGLSSTDLVIDVPVPSVNMPLSALSAATLTLVTRGSGTGAFASIAKSAATNAKWLLDDTQIVYDPTVITLPGAALTWTAVSGDANLDGHVNISDLTVLANNYGKAGTYTWLNGDFNCDGVLNVSDLTLMANNYGKYADDVVPEPMTLGLLALGGLALIRRKR